MNKFLLIILLLTIFGSIAYAGYMYIYKGEYNVSLTVDEQTYFVRNGEIEACLAQSTCLSAE